VGEAAPAGAARGEQEHCGRPTLDVRAGRLAASRAEQLDSRLKCLAAPREPLRKCAGDLEMRRRTRRRSRSLQAASGPWRSEELRKSSEQPLVWTALLQSERRGVVASGEMSRTRAKVSGSPSSAHLLKAAPTRRTDTRRRSTCATDPPAPARAPSHLDLPPPAPPPPPDSTPPLPRRVQPARAAPAHQEHRSPSPDHAVPRRL